MSASTPTTSPASEPYKYQPIEATICTRVIQIHQTPDAGLHCWVKTVDIHLGNYIAISYAWGTSEQSEKTAIGNKKGDSLGFIDITPSLQQLLRDLHGSGKFSGDWFFIDQLSINQQDDDERSAQVRRMGDIFSMAKQVVTYLGPEEPGDAAALELCRDLQLDHPKHHQLQWFLWVPTREQEDIVRPLWALIEMRMSAYRHLIKIALGDWAKRLWMVQENVLNAEALFLRGTSLMPWEEIGRLLALINMACLPITEDVRAVDVPNSLLWILGARERTHKSYLYDIDFLLPTLRLMECRDPRDKIYALLSIVNYAQKLRIVPDYKKPVEQVYAETTLATIPICGLKLLEYVSVNKNPEEAETWPSWAPRWSSQDTYATHVNCYASGTRLVELTPRHDFRILSLKGFRFDTIGDKIRRLDSGDVDTEEECGLDEIAAYFGRRENRADYCSLMTTNALWPLLDQYNYGQSIPPSGHCQTLNVAIEDRARIIQFAFEAKGWHENMEYVSHSSSGQINAGLLRESLGEGVDRLNYDIHYTATRRQMCSVTGEAESGDTLAVLYGGPVFYVLRPHGNNFKLVGTAYVDRFMDGSALDDPNIVEEVFNIV